MSKITVKLDAAKAVLTETNPYELPLPFSNVGLYEFLKRVKFTTAGEKHSYVIDKKTSVEELGILKVLLDAPDSTDICEFNKTFPGVSGREKVYLKRLENIKTSPLKYEVRQPNGKIRELSYLHPAAMMQISAFHFTFQHDILYHASRSPFSLRHPDRVAASFKVKDEGPYSDNVDTSPSEIEHSEKRYAFVRSFFAYSPFVTMWQFFDSKLLEDLEAKYSFCRIMDFARCFDSIYTHSFEWVTNGYRTAKSSTRDIRKSTFGGRADSLTQGLNCRETNGIAIGPEWSRTFAEIVLQEFDVILERKLLEEEGLRRDEDYSIVRYIDDIFIFANSESVLNKVDLAVNRVGRIFKLHINDAKTATYEAPFIFTLTSAKRALRERSKEIAFVKCESTPFNCDIRFDDSRAIQIFKDVVAGYGCEPEAIVNYYLGVLLGTFNGVAGDVDSIAKQNAPSAADDLVHLDIARQRLFSSLINASFHVYRYASSAATSIKFVRVCHVVAKLARARIASKHLQEEVFRNLYQKLCDAFEVEVGRAGVSIQSLIILDVLTSLGRRFPASYLNRLFRKAGVELDDLNAIQLLTILRHCGEGKAKFPASVLRVCKELIVKGEYDVDLSAQRTLLRLSLMDCPFLDVVDVVDITGIEQSVVEFARDEQLSLLFNWDVNESYLFRLAAKTSSAVY